MKHSRLPVAFLAVLAVAVATLVAIASSASPTEAQTGEYLHFTGPGTGWIAVPDAPALNPTTAMTIDPDALNERNVTTRPACTPRDRADTSSRRRTD